MKKFLPFTLTFLAALLSAAAGFAYPSSHYASSSVLSEGRWVKVEVDTTGIFEISYEQLREWGFDDPAKVSVYGMGAVGAVNHVFDNSYPDDMPKAAYTHTADGRLLFYGEGIVRAYVRSKSGSVYYPGITRCYYDKNSYYYLTDSRPVEEVAVREFNENANTIRNWHFCLELRETDVQTPGRGGAFFHGPVLKPGDIESYKFRLRDFCSEANINGYFRYEAAMKTPSRATFSILGDVVVTQQNVAPTLLPSSSSRLYEGCTGIGYFNETKQPLQDLITTFSVQAPKAFYGSYMAVDRVYALYPRKNVIDPAEQLHICLYEPSSSMSLRLFDATETTRVWDVSNTAKIEECSLIKDNTSDGCKLVSMPRSGSVTRLIAFDETAAQRPVKYAGEVSCANFHAMPTPDVLIVTNRTNADAARELAAIHKELQGLDAVVAVQEDVFSEFSFGTRHPGAIRRLAKMFYDRDPEKFRYIILYGRPTYDNRCLMVEPADYLVSYQVENTDAAKDPTTNACADQFFGMLSDGYTHANLAFAERLSVAVGRIPSDNLMMGRKANAKIKAYLEQPLSVRQYVNAIQLSGSGDSHAHIDQSIDADSILCAIQPAMTSVHADEDLYRLRYGSYGDAVQHQELIYKTLSAGVGLFVFSGHADPYALTGVQLYSSRTLANYHYDRWPLAVLSTCNTWPLDFQVGSIVENMLFKEDGGMIGIVGACRSVFLEPNRKFNSAVMRAYASAVPGTTLGQIFVNARNNLIEASGGRLDTTLGNNTLCYNYCGDPTLPVAVPGFGVALDKFGVEAGEGVASVPAPGRIEISARITDLEGGVVSGFNGTAMIDVYESPLARQTIAGSPVMKFESEEQILISIPATVKNGVLSTTAVLPSPVRSNKYNRVVITATAESGKEFAAGASKSFIIAGSADDYADDVDTSAPVIEEMYINSPAFTQGATTGRNITVKAVIDPSATGLSINPFNISGNPALILDGDKTYAEAASAIRLSADGKAYLDFGIKNLTEGRHTLELRVTNHAGESSSALCDFVVAVQNMGLGLAIAGDATTVREPVDFEVDAQGNTLVGARLLIIDSFGSTVVSLDASEGGNVRWDLTDFDGAEVPDGEYTAFVSGRSDTGTGSSNSVKFVVVK